MKYSLPCSCGKSVVVEVAQAGQSVRCACGRTLEVPTMRALRQLEPLSDVPPSGRPRRKRRWSLLQGGVFATGLALMVTGLAAAGYFQLGRMGLQTEPRPWDDLDQALQTIDQMQVDDAFEIWKELRKETIGPYTPPPYIMARYLSESLLKYVLGSLGLATLGLIVMLSAFLFSPRRRKRPTGQRPAAQAPK